MKKKKRFDINMPKGYSRIMHGIILLMSFFGMIIVTSASMYDASSSSLSLLIAKQLVFIVISYIAMVFLARNFKWSWFRLSSISLKIIVLITIGLLLVPRLFPPINGSYNWINLRVATLQPSELAKPVIIGIVASALGNLPFSKWMLDKNKLKKINPFKKIGRVLSIIQWAAISVIAMILIVALVQLDLGTALIIVFTVSIIILMASHPFITTTQRLFLLVFLGVLAIVVFLISPSGIQYLDNLGIKQYQIQRITSLYNLFERDNMLRQSMQQVNGLLAFAKGGLFGNGLGNSILKYGYIPEAESDYILAILIDEFGFIGFFFVTLGFATILFILFKYAFRVQHQPSRLFLIGSATYIFMHYLFNVGGTSGLIPLTGVPLLLISAGGSSQLAVFMTIGICQNIIARHNGNIKLNKKDKKQ